MWGKIRLLLRSRRDRLTAASISRAEGLTFVADVREDWQRRMAIGLDHGWTLPEYIEIFAIGCFQQHLPAHPDIAALPVRAQWDFIIEAIASAGTHSRLQISNARGFLGRRYRMLTVKPET